MKDRFDLNIDRNDCLKSPSTSGRAAVLLGTATVAAIAALTATAAAKYAGSAPAFLLFSCAFFFAIALIAPRPRSYGYGFFATILFLGFWPKVAMHAIWGTSFLEAIGDFSGSPAAWDNAINVATCGAFGVALARTLHLYMARSHVKTDRKASAYGVPNFYARNRRLVWIVSVAAVLFLNIANYHYAFYKIGVNPLLVFPFHLNVVVAWLINIGFAMWIVSLVHWELNLSPKARMTLLSMPLVEAFMASTSAMSRGIFAFHAVPYLIALAVQPEKSGKSYRHRVLTSAAIGFTALFLISISIVFWMRMPSLHGDDIYARPTAELMQTYRNDVAIQMPALLLKRWVGLEGLLALEGSHERGVDLFLAALKESPKTGMDSLFQRIAKVDFNREDPTRPYLSNAGPLAILYMSNSLLLVFAGMFLIGLLIIVTDVVAHRSTANPLLVAVAGAGLANAVAQTTFPYLTVVFTVELATTILILGVAHRKLVDLSSRGSGIR